MIQMKPVKSLKEGQVRCAWKQCREHAPDSPALEYDRQWLSFNIAISPTKTIKAYACPRHRDKVQLQLSM